MKYLIIISLFMFTLYPVNAEDWYSKTHWVDKNSHFYVGISSGSRNLEESMERAYRNAIREAIRHLFAIQVQVKESSFSTIKNEENVQEILLNTEVIHLYGVKTGRQHITEDKDGSYLIYREIVYPIKNIIKERKRLKKARVLIESPFSFDKSD